MHFAQIIWENLWKFCLNIETRSSRYGSAARPIELNSRRWESTVLPAGSDIKETERIGTRACKTTETLGKSQKGQRIGHSSKTSSHSSSCASASRERTYWPTHRYIAFLFQCKQMYAFGWKVWHNRKTPCRLCYSNCSVFWC